MADNERSEERKDAYARIAKAGLLDASHHKNADELGLVATIGFLSRVGPLLAPLIEHPEEDVRSIATDVVARLAVDHLKNPTVAAAELVRAMALEPLSMQPLARQYIVARAAVKAGDALLQIDRERASMCYDAVLDAIAAMEEPQQDAIIDAMNALEKPLALTTTWLQLHQQSS